MPFVIFNRSTKRYLTHPRSGMWVTNNQNEAVDMAKTAEDYFSAVGMAGQVEVREVDKNFYCEEELD